MTTKQIFEIQYYEERLNSVFPNRRKMLVDAETEDEALEYVKETVDGFDGFPYDHVAAKVVRTRDIHLADE